MDIQKLLCESDLKVLYKKLVIENTFFSIGNKTLL